MAYFDSLGVKFSDDKKTLIDCPRDFEGSYSIPIGVVEIGSSAFENCTGLSSVEIPESVVTIGMGAFAGCENLQKIHISQNVTSIGEMAFVDIGASLLIEVDEQNAYYCSDESGTLYTKDKSLLIHACDRVTNNLIVPEGVKNIGSSGFQWANFRMVSLPASLEKIAPEAFLSASIRELYLHHDNPYKIEVGADAFDECAPYCTLYIPQKADSLAYNWHPEFKNFKMILFWNVGQYWQYRVWRRPPFEDAYDALADITATKECYFELNKEG